MWKRQLHAHGDMAGGELQPLQQRIQAASNETHSIRHAPGACAADYNVSLKRLI